MSELLPITLDDLCEAEATFRAVEGRGSYYDMALRLLKAGFEIEGCVLLLATWNVGRFRFAQSTFDVEAFTNVVSRDLRDDFQAFAGLSIQNVELDKLGNRVEGMFNRLATIKGVEYTGAAKLLHLKCPDVFVMWDDYIRGGKRRTYYDCLPCVRAGKWRFVEYGRSGKEYVRFLSDTQTRFRELSYPPSTSKTLAKVIDEFNYVNVTLPIQVLIERPLEEAKKQAAKAKKMAAGANN
jgi:hypothetical protein